MLPNVLIFPETEDKVLSVLINPVALSLKGVIAPRVAFD